MDKDNGKVLVNGAPMETYLAEQLGVEARQTQKETVSEHARVLRKRVPARFAFGGKQGVASRPRTWTDREIRLKKGILMKPYKGQVKNILWCILEKGPISAEEIAAELKLELRSVRPILSKLRKRIPEIIGQPPGKPPQPWIALQPVSTERAYSEYLRVGKLGKQMGPLQEDLMVPTPTDMYISKLKERIVQLEAELAKTTAGAPCTLMEAFGELDRQGKLKIEVTHKVEVRFGTLREDELR